MARLPRLVLSHYPYHVTQRSNRRQQVFFEDADYPFYPHLLGEAPQRACAEIRAYYLMPNHVHVMVVPSDEDGLRRTFAEAHRRALSKVVSQVIDVSGGVPGASPHVNNYAIKDQEVLVRSHILPQAITPIR